MTGRAQRRAAEAEARPLYSRVLGLRHVQPSGLLRFLFLEGMIFVAVLLSLAELVSWWSVLVLPLAVALMVKINDVIAGAIARAVAHTPSRAKKVVGRAAPKDQAAPTAAWDPDEMPIAGQPVRGGRRRADDLPPRSEEVTRRPDDNPHASRRSADPAPWSQDAADSPWSTASTGPAWAASGAAAAPTFPTDAAPTGRASLNNPATGNVYGSRAGASSDASATYPQNGAAATYPSGPAAYPPAVNGASATYPSAASGAGAYPSGSAGGSYPSVARGAGSYPPNASGAGTTYPSAASGAGVAYPSGSRGAGAPSAGGATTNHPPAEAPPADPDNPPPTVYGVALPGSALAEAAQRAAANPVVPAARSDAESRFKTKVTMRTRTPLQGPADPPPAAEPSGTTYGSPGRISGPPVGTGGAPAERPEPAYGSNGSSPNGYTGTTYGSPAYGTEPAPAPEATPPADETWADAWGNDSDAGAYRRNGGRFA